MQIDGSAAGICNRGSVAGLLWQVPSSPYFFVVKVSKKWSVFKNSVSKEEKDVHMRNSLKVLLYPL